MKSSMFEPMTAKEKEEMFRSDLSFGSCRVMFRKADDSVREMICTTNSALIGDRDTPVPVTNGFMKEGVIRVFDLEAKAWRSFRVDRVMSFESGICI